MNSEVCATVRNWLSYNRMKVLRRIICDGRVYRKRGKKWALPDQQYSENQEGKERLAGRK